MQWSSFNIIQMRSSDAAAGQLAVYRRYHQPIARFAEALKRNSDSLTAAACVALSCAETLLASSSTASAASITPEGAMFCMCGRN